MSGQRATRAQARRHPADRVVSATTYQAHGCRCDGCRTAASEYKRKWRIAHPEAAATDWRRQQYRYQTAWQWVRDNHPDIAAVINDEARKAHP